MDIERVRLQTTVLHRWTRAAAVVVAGLVGAVGVAQAQRGAVDTSLKVSAEELKALPASLSRKMAGDLLKGLEGGPKAPSGGWASNVGQVRYVKALVFSSTSSTDPNLDGLSKAVTDAKGVVYMRYTAVRGLSVLLPARGVLEIAKLDDVQSISPNRLTARSFSALEESAGINSKAVRVAKKNSSGNAVDYAGVTGAGVGIAILDSGIMRNHDNFAAGTGGSRVANAVDFTRLSDAALAGAGEWATTPKDYSAFIQDGKQLLLKPGTSIYEQRISNYGGALGPQVDGYGHGTHVASIAAGRAFGRNPNSSGIAPGATLYDVKVLVDTGFGAMSDVLSAIDWVIFHSRTLNIRVLNLSLAADSTESYVTDPLCRAARSAVAAGITVVVAAGNYGKMPDGRKKWAEVYGSVGSPGIEPSVITVGSANTKGTIKRNDDVVNYFSSRGPSRGVYLDERSAPIIDNALKPDLVAPGNRILGALALNVKGERSELAKAHKDNVPKATTDGVPTNGTTPTSQLVTLSGTSIAAPAVAGAVALLLEANPGLTPPLIKAMLQYTAEPLGDANLLQQGTGMLNVDGALRLARVIRPGLRDDVEMGQATPGASLLGPQQTGIPSDQSIPNANGAWSRMIFVGGNRILSGDALFLQYHLAWDHRISWGGTVGPRKITAKRSSTGSLESLSEAPVEQYTTLFGPGVLLASALVVPDTLNSWQARTGVFTPTARIAQQIPFNAKQTDDLSLPYGLVLSGNTLQVDNLDKKKGKLTSALTKGLALAAGLTLAEGLTLSEGLTLAEGLALSEASEYKDE